ncbi:GTPase HflX [Kamptonema cortianum]|nr:GTPase HflX [Kamptonema cortianum]
MGMHKLKPIPMERVMLVGLAHGSQTVWDVEESLKELDELARSAGAHVSGVTHQKLDEPTAAYYIGKGKAEELAKRCKAEKVDMVIFDDDLNPAQGRNLSEIFKVKVIDRTELILDIFAQRARTKEGRIQVELAQLQYLLPRLKRMWLHLSRQAGGIGGRGPGETQLEVDRRRIQEKISRLKQELKGVRATRATQRHARERNGIPVVSMVGYTNAGKSTLMNAMTGAGVLAVDQLFATLDPTTRQFILPNKLPILVSDTVGFIRKLPTHLVEAFKATLEEVIHADLLLHVIDVSHEHFEQHMEAVDTILQQIGAWGKPTILVFNKIDLLGNPHRVRQLVEHYPNSAAISAKNHTGLDALAEEIMRQFADRSQKFRLKIPIGDAHAIAEVRSKLPVLHERYTGKNAFIEAIIPETLFHRFSGFVVSESD